MRVLNSDKTIFSHTHDGCDWGWCKGRRFQVDGQWFQVIHSDPVGDSYIVRKSRKPTRLERILASVFGYHK
jgi:hypothetical protein